MVNSAAAEKLINDSYVDDGYTGGTLHEVEEMMCEKVDSKGSVSYKSFIPHILAKAGFSVKVMVKSGKNPQAYREKMGGMVLGHEWNSDSDIISFPYRFHYGKKYPPGVPKMCLP